MRDYATRTGCGYGAPGASGAEAGTRQNTAQGGPSGGLEGWRAPVKGTGGGSGNPYTASQSLGGRTARYRPARCGIRGATSLVISEMLVSATLSCGRWAHARPIRDERVSQRRHTGFTGGHKLVERAVACLLLLVFGPHLHHHQLACIPDDNCRFLVALLELGHCSFSSH